ncbi:hypothetical protein E2C01_095320 [Portunus trituberculatus]|uniref:Uncharacterized protein n=1 Tax=Portunus trituberculatus TaxID=210409 RepID=A0A5B7JZ36_PORTR|nr:hypothetical protein [Portunus trituberculatus]
MLPFTCCPENPQPPKTPGRLSLRVAPSGGGLRCVPSRWCLTRGTPGRPSSSSLTAGLRSSRKLSPHTPMTSCLMGRRW